MRIIITPMSENTQQSYLRELAAALRGHGHTVLPLQTRQLMRQHADVVIVNWPENVAASAQIIFAAANTVTYVAALLVRRLAGQRIILLWHNSRPHEMVRPHVQSLLLRATERVANDIVFLSQHTRTVYMQHRRRHSRPRLHNIPFGVNPVPGRPSPPSQDNTRPPNVLWFGIVREYKGLADLLRAHQVLPADAMDLTVLANDAYASPDLSYVRQRLRSGSVRGMVGSFSDQLLKEALAKADLSAFPFRRIDNSSSVFTSLAARCPVLLPLSPLALELEELAGDCVSLYSPPLTPHVLQEKATQLSQKHRHGELTWEWLERHNWGSIGRRWSDLLQSSGRTSA